MLQLPSEWVKLGKNCQQTKEEGISSTLTTNVEVQGETIASDEARVVAQRNNKQAETERDDNETNNSGKQLLW